MPLPAPFTFLLAFLKLCFSLIAFNFTFDLAILSFVIFTFLLPILGVSFTTLFDIYSEVPIIVSLPDS